MRLGSLGSVRNKNIRRKEIGSLILNMREKDDQHIFVDGQNV